MIANQKSPNRSAEPPIKIRGAVAQVLNGARFRVALPNGQHVLAGISGGVRKRFVRISEGDVVGLELSPYDLGAARISVPPKPVDTTFSR